MPDRFPQNLFEDTFDDGSSQNLEIKRSYDGFKKDAYNAMNAKDDKALALALDGMYRTGTTEKELQNIIDYIPNQDSEFKQMVLRKIEEIRETNQGKDTHAAQSLPLLEKGIL